jgi:hypothetical protein
MKRGGKKPCWNNYKMVGMKPKNDKMVPNCVYNKKGGKLSKKLGKKLSKKRSKLNKKQKGGNKKFTKRKKKKTKRKY